MPKLVDGAARREAIAEATWRCVARAGLDAVRMRDIANEAGCTTGMIMHHFKDKNDVFTEALELVMTRFERTIETYPPCDAEGLIGLICSLLPMDEDRIIQWRVALHFIAHKPVSERQSNAVPVIGDRWAAFLAASLEAMVRAGGLRQGSDIIGLARHLIVTIDGIGINAAANPEAWPPELQEQIVREQVSRLGVGPSGT